MKIPNFALLAFAGILLPASTFAEEVNGVIKKDTVQTASKEVTNRNMLLNASSADQPRQINDLFRRHGPLVKIRHSGAQGFRQCVRRRAIAEDPMIYSLMQRG